MLSNRDLLNSDHWAYIPSPSVSCLTATGLVGSNNICGYFDLQNTVKERTAMPYRRSISAIGLLTAICLLTANTKAQDAAKYPDWRGQWERFVVPGVPDNSHDQTKPRGY